MKNILISKKAAWICIGFLLGALHAFATNDPPISKYLDGGQSQLHVDSFTTVEDSKFFDPAYNAVLVKPYFVQNRVTLMINESSNWFLKSAFSATVRVRVEKTQADLSVTTVDTSLSINYDTSSTYISKRSYLFTNAYRVKVTILSLSTDAAWNIWPGLIIENEMQAAPNYRFWCDSSAIQTITAESLAANTTNDQLNVSWANRIGADVYDLEWAYVDSSALSNRVYGPDSMHPDPNLLFDNNASRVTVRGSTYAIPLFFDSKGSLFYRVRPVQYAPGGVLIQANWSSNYSGGLGRFDFNGHAANLNWQSTTNFAEEGKRKTVMQYYDGSLRSRQTVTKDNSTNTTLVSESFYDYQGRPVIQVLPAPTLSNVIAYSQSFNRGLNSSVSYDKDNFDHLVDPSTYCNAGATAMDTSNGAARYYSKANPQKDSSFHKFIPDAEGFPFTEVEYTQDNTGRINRQSGVGFNYKLGSGHEIKYFYGTPDQQEIDALFGTEVGVASHYFKTMVQDANGQYSVSYTDMHGRTIATALAGSLSGSSSMSPLASQRSLIRTASLSDSSKVVIKDLAMESKSALLVTNPGPRVFTYLLNPASLTLNDCNNTPVCYDCLYDLEIIITDNCNNQNLPGGHAFDTVVHNFSLSSIDTTCSNPAASFSFSFTQYLSPGSYDITKKLSISRYGLSYYRDSVFTRKNTCKTSQTFVSEQRSLQALITQCKPTCQSCNDSLGTLSQFAARFKKGAGIDSADNSYDSLITTSYANEQANCAQLCNKATDINDIRNAMLLDMTAPSGQYANQDSAQDKYSIFFAHVPSGSKDTTEPYRNPSLIYVDQDGNPDLVYDEITGQMVKPQALSPSAFAAKFKLSWAKALLPLHPEYCKLLRYQNLQSSFDWDHRFEGTTTYADARKYGYLNPLGNTGASVFTRFNATGTADYDPLPASTYNARVTLNNTILQFKALSGGTYSSMWEVAMATTKCTGKNQACFTSYLNEDSSFASSTCTADLDVAWRTFRELYQNAKRSLVNQHLTDSCGSTPSGTALMAVGHQPHFSDAGELFSASGTTLPTTITAANAFRDQNQAQINAYYDANCRAYVTQWLQQLAPCNYTPGDSAVIIPLLIQVCRKGADIDHPYGASSINPDSSGTYRNFEAVISAYNASSGRSNSVCNAYLITAPKPYDQQVVYSEKPIWTAPDTCECNQISKLYNSYRQVSGSYSSFSSYLLTEYQTTMTDSVANLLLSLCAAAHAGAPCNYLPSPISLPAAMQCYSGDVCISCQQFKLLDAEFKSKFPGTYPYANPSLQDSLHQAGNKLYARFMNYKTGFVKTAADYISFSNSCGVATSNSNPSCDSLRSIAIDFTAGKNLLPDSSIVDTAHFVAGVSFTNYTYPGSNAQIFAGGFAHFPDSLVLADAQLVTTPFTYFRKKDTLCVNDEFTLVGKLKFQLSSRGKRYYATNLLFNADSLSYDVVFEQASSPADTTALMAGTDYLGYYLTDGSIDRSVNHLKSYIRNFDTARVVKIQAHNKVISTYIDGVLVSAAYYTARISKIYSLAVGFEGTGGYLDYLKVYDGSGTLQYSEEFEDSKNSASNRPPAMRCDLVDCSGSFTSYFNKRKASNYSFHQIDSIYNLSCGGPLDVCNNILSASFSADSLNHALSDFSTQKLGYYYTQHLDSAGIDTTNWKVVTVGNSSLYTDPHSFNYFFGGGTLNFPSGYILPHLPTTFDYYNNLCFGTSGFSFEIKLKIPDSSLLYPNYGNSDLRLDLYGYDQDFIYYSSQRNKFTFLMDNDPASGTTPYYLITDSTVSFNNYRVLKISAVKDSVFYYLDGTLHGKYKTLNRLTRLRGWSIDPFASKIQVDYIKMYDSTGTLRYFEDFNTAGTLAQPTFSRTPNFNCTYSFASFFNARFKTQYDFAQIDSIYFELTGAHVNVCADNCSLTCDTLQKLNQQFLGGYDSLVNTACTGTPYSRAADSVSCCQKNFAKFVNAKLHTSFSYQDIIGAYSVCGVNLVSCAPPVNGNTLCGRSAPVFAPVTDIPVTNCTDSAFFAVSKGTELYNAYADSLVNLFDSSYRSKCMQAYKYESFTVTDTLSEYHYTLYYYDQAGNLVKTIPPEGVDLSKFGWLASWRDSVNRALAQNQVLTPGHWLPTQYRYNTLNQVTGQHTPDAWESYFWYDRLGRLSISENARQRAASGSETNRLYSYTLYDAIGRITEVGEIKNAGTAAMTDSISRAPGLLASWLAVSVAGKSQVTQTVYDLPYAGFTGLSPVPLLQQNLRNRVSYTSFTLGSNAARFNQASYYSYDIHGNVDTLLQDYGSELNTEVRNPLNALGNRFKRMVYQYDLISGKVNQVAYQSGQPDQFFHRYSYDAENRLVLAETSADSLLWERDARYQYYKHGPLARLRLGDQLVQGLDYAYTLQGWLKGVNGTSLDSTYDMGLDGRPGENQYVARDAYGFVLNYYSGDYNNISALYKPFPGFSSRLNNEYRPLFNGNISSQAVNLPRLGAPLLYNYRYDQLNRLVAQDGYSGLNPAANRWDTLILSPAYRERIAYDANGNILKYLRNGMTANPAMDSLQYYYNRDGQGRLLNNQLLRVRDSVGASSYPIDIDNQPLNNYDYDPIGNLIKDSAENISSITWNVYGKITEIQKTATASNPVVDIKYFYDAGGNRIGKAVKLAGSDSLAYSWYVRDASGNVMALYESRGLDTGYSHYNLFLTEQHLYGSSRLGMLKRNVDLTPGNGVLQNSRFIRGNKFFELSNHLGNVLATVSDKKTGVSSNGTTIDYYRPELITAQDYYPFGMLMPGRSGASTRSGSPADETGTTVPPATLDITSRSGNSPVIYQAITSIIFDNGFASSSTDAFETIIGDTYTGGGATGGTWVDGSSGYRYGFNGKEQDPDTYGQGNEYDYGFRIYNPRLGRFLSVDPIGKKFPWNSLYSYSEGNPINYLDIDGGETGVTPAQSVPRPVFPEIGNLRVSPEGVLENSSQLFPNGTINSGAYAPQSKFISQKELEDLIPPNAGAYLNPDGISITIIGPNGAWVESILKKKEPKKQITWVDRLLLSQEGEKLKQFNFNIPQWNVNIEAYEIITTDPTTLPDEYLNEVNRRLLNGTATDRDKFYAAEVEARKSQGKINEPDKVSFIQGKGDKAVKRTTDVPKGYSRTKLKSHGQPVFSNGKNWITPDTDGHNGGIWKMFGKEKYVGSTDKTQRLGTYDANLIWRGN